MSFMNDIKPETFHVWNPTVISNGKPVKMCGGFGYVICDDDLKIIAKKLEKFINDESKKSVRFEVNDFMDYRNGMDVKITRNEDSYSVKYETKHHTSDGGDVGEFELEELLSFCRR